ncbi:hypothetical protein WH47_05925 [Habropoda laboriosa]|uniref:Histone-lysine N-methyltransferase SETMAR n=1 Tax=Habropoda laboriosa TaxID=597456 RepID=A0A0L7RE58_9HYME|nr:hypothetical protein WH47_05925 [Habropoda laboriosa]
MTKKVDVFAEATSTNLLGKDRRLRYIMIAEESTINKTVVHTILRDIVSYRKMCAKFVPYFLTAEQKEVPVSAFQHFVDMANLDGNFLNRIIIDNESWYFEYNPSTKRPVRE